MSTPTIGSLFSGYGGLDMGVQSVTGGRVSWVSDIEPGPSRILATHHPDIPNLGDVTTIDWRTVEPVDVICGGSPCQDLSMAGRRAGMRPGTRSGLWESMLAAITTIRPRLVVWENVRGALSADAFTLCNLEPGSGHLGDRPARPSLRALGRVLGDLANVGYDSEWCCLRASDIGAPHRRERVFVVAYPQGQPWGSGDGEHGVTGDPDRHRPDRTPVVLSTPTARDAKDHRIARNPKRPDATDTLSRALTLLPTPTAERPDGRKSSGFREGHANFHDIIKHDQFGQFAPAIARWETATGRPAPEPTEPGRTAPRLSARFAEWMMGLPDGWVTDVDISRTAQLRALGNGVVPQQAAAAIRTILTNHQREHSMNNLFRKRPVTIEARQLDGDMSNDHDIYLWIEDCVGSFDPLSEEIPTSGMSIDPSDGSLMIATLEGVMHARRDDWIIRGVAGEFYACRDDIFRATYEPAGEACHG